MTLEELAKKTKNELLSLARELKIKNRSKMTKEQLIESLNTVQTKVKAKMKLIQAEVSQEDHLKQPPEPVGLSTQETYRTELLEEARFPSFFL